MTKDRIIATERVARRGLSIPTRRVLDEDPQVRERPHDRPATRPAYVWLLPVPRCSWGRWREDRQRRVVLALFGCSFVPLRLVVLETRLFFRCRTLRG